MRSFVFVDGVDGCGKSTFAAAMLRHLKTKDRPAISLAVDDFRRTIDWAAEPDEAAAYFERYFDLAALGDVLDALAHGAADVAVPQFKEGRPEAGPRIVQVPDNAIVLVEGVFTQRLPQAVGSPLVYLDLDWPLAKDRVLARDQARGRSRQEVQHRIDRRYFPAQSRYHDGWSPQQSATWLVKRTATRDALERAPGASPAPGLTHADTKQVDAAVRAALVAPPQLMGAALDVSEGT